MLLTCRLLSSTVLILVLFVPVVGQSIPHTQAQRATVTGVVTDQSDGKPLPGVSVFLSGTMLGAATDSLGMFSIDSVPIGSFQLVASMIGYETEVRQIEATKPEFYGFAFQLKPIVYDLDEIRVTDSFDRNWWRRRLQMFKRGLFSTTRNAAACEILNPLVLDFMEENYVLRASASEPLVVVNRRLGYRITFVLEEFDYNMLSGTIRYFLYPVYEELEPRDEKEAQRFRQRRLEAYEGSIRHFLRLLVQHRDLNIDSFTHLTGFTLGRTTWLDGESPGQTILDLSKGIPFQVESDPVVIDSLLQETETGELVLRDSLILAVQYKREREAYEYLRFPERRDRVPGHQLSVLDILHPVTVDSRGLQDDPEDIIKYGYMGWERFADTLPYEYEPPENPPEKKRPWWRFW